MAKAKHSAEMKELCKMIDGAGGKPPIAIPKRLLSAWEVLKGDYPSLTLGYNPGADPADPNARGYWLTKRTAVTPEEEADGITLKSEE
jgi:hypothetical protein